MARHARRSAHLTAVDPIAQGYHLSRDALWKICCCCVGMRAFRGLGDHSHDRAGRSGRTRAWSKRRRTSRRASLIDNSVDSSPYIVGHIECSVRSHCQTTGSMYSATGGLDSPREPISKYFTLAGCALAGDPLKDQVVTALFVWSPIPGSVEGDEDAVTVAGRKSLLV